MPPFSAKIAVIGVNPYVLLPKAQLTALFAAAGRERGPIPIRGRLDDAPFRQTLVKYQGAWRLYLNTPIRQAIGKDVCDRVSVRVDYDPKPPKEPMPKQLEGALAASKPARDGFAALTPSRQKEILRYLNAAKTQATRDRNVKVVVDFLCGKKTTALGGVLRTNTKPPRKRLRK